jgi:hypothetical protein
MEGGRRFRADYDLLSLDFSAFSQISNNEAYIWPESDSMRRVLSNEIKLDHSFHLRNLDGISRQARMACVAATAPAPFPFNTGLQAGV